MCTGGIFSQKKVFSQKMALFKTGTSDIRSRGRRRRSDAATATAILMMLLLLLLLLMMKLLLLSRFSST